MDELGNVILKINHILDYYLKEQKPDLLYKL
jgi:hypothetical protein